VDPEHAVWVGIALVLLIAGLLLGQRLWVPPGDTPGASLRLWLWERRSLDLAVQVGLIFAGALGIAALLPRGKEDEEE